MLEKKVEKYLENHRKIVAVKAEDNFKLRLTFDNAEVRFYDMRDKLQGIFSVLQDVNKFKTVFLDECGNVAWDIDDSIDSSVHWNNRIDLCKDALYMDSRSSI